jgi:hypothetical protein
MKIIYGRITSMFYSGLGECMICIRTAFQCAAVGWLTAGTLSLFGLSTLSLMTAIVAIILTALWFAHLLVHAGKAAAARGESSEPRAGHSRRAVLPIFLRAFAAGAILSTHPALADVYCRSGTGACGQDNCPDCYRACYNGPTPCVKCRSCGNNCGDNTC